MESLICSKRCKNKKEFPKWSSFFCGKKHRDKKHSACCQTIRKGDIMKQKKGIFAVLTIGIILCAIISVFGIGDAVKGADKMRFGIDIRGGVEAVFEPEGLERKATEKELEAARTVIENRLDVRNITDREVTIDKNGGYIIVRFPWKADESEFKPEEAIAELGDMAQLTFRDEEGNVLLDGSHVDTSVAQKDTSTTAGNRYVVSLSFDKEGAKLFEKATEEQQGKHMGIYMDEDLISNPMVEAKISGGNAVINGMSGFEEAQALAEKISAGSLPFSLKTTNFSTISPTLGNQALHIMVGAGILAFFIICFFMIGMYKLPGVIACMTLLLQMSLQLLAISIPQYTLTLPGIAGIILSLGMAVDTNIIISERIADELRTHENLHTAIKYGYKNAFSSVLDGNLTTAIVAIILMIFGSGSMLSFGYTLLAGMIINVFVGVSVSKKLIYCILEFKRMNDRKWFREKKVPTVQLFYQKKWIYALVSGVIFIVGIGACIGRGVTLDTQFTGGVVLSCFTDKVPDTEQIEAAVEKIMNRPVTIQITEDNVSGKSSIQITLAGTGGLSPKEQEQVLEAVNSVDASLHAVSSETYAVEPYIGARALKDAVTAIVLSLIFIVIYVWIRFSTLGGMAAGITAILALIHDVLVVFFAFALFGIPLNDAFVAVALTIIGYSINDTIVLYDRIRENRKSDKHLEVVELVNESTTQTFARSINTSVTSGLCVLIMLGASIVFHLSSIFEFSLPMFFGLVSGCYSSICIAGTLWAMWEKRKENIQ